MIADMAARGVIFDRHAPRGELFAVHAHETIQSITGARPGPHTSKRGDEGTDPDWILEILEEVDRYQRVAPWQRNLVRRVLLAPADEELVMLPRQRYIGLVG